MTGLAEGDCPAHLVCEKNVFGTTYEGRDISSMRVMNFNHLSGLKMKDTIIVIKNNFRYNRAFIPSRQAGLSLNRSADVSMLVQTILSK